MYLKEKLKETETLSLEKTRLQAFCDEKQSEIDQLKKESQGLTEQIEYMRKEVNIYFVNKLGKLVRFNIMGIDVYLFYFLN